MMAIDAVLQLNHSRWGWRSTMLSLRVVLVLAASVLSAAAIPRGAVAAGGSGPVLAPSDDQPMDGLLPRQEVIVGR